MRSIIFSTMRSRLNTAPVWRRTARSRVSPGCALFAASKAAGSVTESRNRSAMSSANARPESSWMNPSWGMVPVTATATWARAYTAVDAWLMAWLARSALSGAPRS